VSNARRGALVTLRLLRILGALGILCPTVLNAGETPLVEHFLSRAQTITGREYEVVRMDLDLTGDEKPELLLGIGGRIIRWYVYERITDERCRFLGSLSSMT
jgi:hypothetical protein